ncbi:hypothetical protein Egran_01242 [Elaphomyces granulatus]|uniref:Nuclear transport factor 2 n=1 Tax=Elaphomyces granulatus TaxID=519963 RepID=A0A232M3L2_9EURO|nr:hypothetical protein Egran_01242 [Elaphomyces granulatus]
MKIILLADDFVKFYYESVDTDPVRLAHLYCDSSMLTYENEKEPFYGKDAIIKKLCDQRLAFQRVAHVRNTITAQPANGGALILVTGTVMFDEERPVNYVQTFQLLPDGQGNVFVLNDIFKLIFG